jgi:hypothetical protein
MGAKYTAATAAANGAVVNGEGTKARGAQKWREKMKELQAMDVDEASSAGDDTPAPMDIDSDATGSEKENRRRGQGSSSLPKDDDIEVQDWCSYVDTFDVVIVTYSTLRTDFNVALPGTERSRRSTANYSSVVDRPRSPLIMVEWYRVVMDEVQMVGGGKTEYVFFPGNGAIV